MITTITVDQKVG